MAVCWWNTGRYLAAAYARRSQDRAHSRRARAYWPEAESPRPREPQNIGHGLTLVGEVAEAEVEEAAEGIGGVFYAGGAERFEGFWESECGQEFEFVGGEGDMGVDWGTIVPGDERGGGKDGRWDFDVGASPEQIEKDGAERDEFAWTQSDDFGPFVGESFVEGAWLTDELSDAFDALANALFAEGSGLAFGMKGFEGVG